jgi:tetratricopeptide (TPR) repeat protein
MEELAGLLRSPVVFERQGDRALARGDIAAAVEAFRRGLTLAADHVPLKQKLATALAVSGDIPAALTLYQELLTQNPNFAEAHYSLGALHLGSGRPDLALPRFAAAVKAEPSYLHARLQLAHTLRRLGRLEDALVEYQGALAVDPRFADARFAYAISLAGLRRWGTARAWLLEGRRSHPDRAEFTEALARLLAAAPDENVRDEPAALDLARGLAGQARSWNTLETLAMALAANGQAMEAASRQREAIDAYRTVAGKPSPGMAENLTRYERGERAPRPWTVDPVR